MIELENLNNQSLEAILDEYKKQIIYLSNEWTNHQEPDPGITLLELFCWLKSVQHEYLNRISKGVKYKFLKLLDIDLLRNRGAETFLAISDLQENVNLPIRTKWLSGDMNFENSYNQQLINADILSVKFTNPESTVEYEYYKFDGNKSFFLFGSELKEFNGVDERSFTINFDKELSPNSVISLYFSNYIEDGLKRIPIDENEKFEEMAELSYEYYGYENFKTAWHKLDVISDETHNFLYSGIVKFKIEGKMVPNKGVYSVKIKIIKSEYDFPPRIVDLKVNVIKVTQNLCKCDNIILKKDEITHNTLKLSNAMALYGDHKVYVKKFDGWVEIKNFSYIRDIKSGKLILKIENLEKLVEKFNTTDENLMIVCYDQDIKNRMILGSGTGASNQFIEFRDKNLLYDGIEIMVGEEIDGEIIYRKWHRVDDFFSSGKYDRHYVLNYESETITFGDHEYGIAPKKGANNIILCKLNYCRGSDSNINSNMINKVITENKVLQNARIVQIMPGVYGRDDETPEHAEVMTAEIFSKYSRAITIEDYYKIVENTPGIIFKNIKILPNYMEGENIFRQNCVSIAVRWNNQIGAELPESYKKNIMTQINKFRILNTKVKVFGPEYIGVIISGKITVNSFYKENDKLIEKEIENFVENLNNDMGSPLLFGDLFGIIDRLPYVSNVMSLNIVPIGKYTEKTSSEDIIVPPNGIYYVKNINLRFVKSAEIFR